MSSKSFILQLINEDTEEEFEVQFSLPSKYCKSKLNLTNNSGKAYLAALGPKPESVAFRMENGLEFVPNKTLSVVSKVEEGMKIFYLNLSGVDLIQIEPYKDEANPNTIKVYVVPRDDFQQLGSLIFELGREIPKDLLNDLEIDLLLSIINLDGNRREIFKKFPFKNWIDLFLQEFNNYKVFLVDKDEDCISVDLKESNNFSLLKCDGSEYLKVKTFMHFKMKFKPLIDELSATEQNYTKESFRHEVTNVGKRCIEEIKEDLIACFDAWNRNNTKLLAPIVSLFQSSGSGKSKLAIEILKKNPGFYYVFRGQHETGYPIGNVFSEELYYSTLCFHTPSTDQSDVEYSHSGVGRILHKFSIVFTTYFYELMNRVIDSRPNSTNLIESVNSAISSIAEEFEGSNEEIAMNFNRISEDHLKSLYADPVDEITVNHIAIYLKNLLESPGMYMKSFDYKIEMITEEDFIKVWDIVAEKLKRFPFIVVLDEADFLANMFPTEIGTGIRKPFSKKINCFENLIRSISYLIPETKVFFMTLGTKSTIIDLKSPVNDYSSKFDSRNIVMHPLILTSNFNIFSENYPIYSLEPTFNLLRNPLMFKFLTTIGRGLWAAAPFDYTVDLACTKLKNRSETSGVNFLPMWMALTGITANHLSLNTSSLVASHMGTLLDISEDLTQLTITYPSEPIMAIAAHKVMSEDRENELNLFKSLMEKIEDVIIGRVEKAKAIVAMAVLRTIAKTPSAPVLMKCSNPVEYKKCLDAILVEAPQFAKLWRTKSHLLEKESEDKTCTDFRSYKVHSVKGFLLNWNCLNRSNPTKSFDDLSDNVLGGLINATHFCRLKRNSKGFKVKNINILPVKMPSADQRISDSTRNVIDSDLLKYGLKRQCGFFLPADHYGIALIIPVCMKNGGYTFISIQVKVDGANFTVDVYKMQARLNFVQCPKCEKFGENNVPNCEKCIKKDELRTIYENQVSLLVSLADEDDFKSETSQLEETYKQCNDTDIAKLRNALKKCPEDASNFTVSMKNQDFLEPLIRQHCPLTSFSLLSKTLWADSACVMPAPSSNRKKEFFRSSTKQNELIILPAEEWFIVNFAFILLDGDNLVIFLTLPQLNTPENLLIRKEFTEIDLLH